MKERIKKVVKDVPMLGPLARQGNALVRRMRFPGSQNYWESRYARGETSGQGSYGALAAFKAEVLNGFVAENGVDSVIEFGCGDGAQLALATYPRYIGLDVSPTAVTMCIERFAADATKSFFLFDTRCFADRQGLFRADLALSLDVIYHLVEDRVFERYMAALFGAARRFVIIYSSDREAATSSAHVRHRQFTRWVDRHIAGWRLVERVPNRYPEAEATGSFADFFVYEKTA